MEIKRFIIEEKLRENALGVRFIENPEIEWKIDDSGWVPYYLDEPVPDDWSVRYVCKGCKKQKKDSLKTLKKYNFECLCYDCRNKDEKEYDIHCINSNGWTEVAGHKVQGPFEEMVAQWLLDKNIEFKTHGEIEKNIYYTNPITGKKRKFKADFYLPEYDVFLEPHSSITDVYFDNKIKELKETNKLIVIPWDNWRPFLRRTIEKMQYDSYKSHKINKPVSD